MIILIRKIVKAEYCKTKGGYVMKGLKKLLAAMLAMAMVVGLFAAAPAEAKSKKKLVGIPCQINGTSWVDMWAYGHYVKDVVPKTDAQYAVSYELYVPFVAFSEWNESGQWDDEDETNLFGKLCLQPNIVWHSSDENGEPLDIFIRDFNEWGVNHALKWADDEFTIDGLWTEETGSLFVEDVEGEGVMTIDRIDDMVKITVKNLKAFSNEMLCAGQADEWEEKPFEGKLDGTESLNFQLQFHQWIGGDQVETVYLSSASISMNGKTIWKALMDTENATGSPVIATDAIDPEGFIIFDAIESPAVSFNTAYLTLAKDTVEVKAKKSVSVKVTTMNPGDKVTVKSSSKKIATVKLKNGKVKITGKKKGTAKITVTNNGVSKEISVTVK